MEAIEDLYISHFHGTERTEPQLEMLRRDTAIERSCHALFDVLKAKQSEEEISRSALGVEQGF